MPAGSALAGRLHAGLRGLSPGSFATVMSTGIISVGLGYDGRRLLSRCLPAISVAVFAGLVVLTGWRLFAYPAELVADLTPPTSGFGFYTFVAAADVLATRIAADQTDVALWLLGLAAAAWLLRGYAVPWTTRLRPDERPLGPRPTARGSSGRSGHSPWRSRRQSWPAYSPVRRCPRSPWVPGSWGSSSTR